MKSGFRFTLCLAIAVALAGTTHAQLSGANSGEASLTAQGVDPSGDPNHDVDGILPGTLVIVTSSGDGVVSNPNQSVIFTASNTDPVPPGLTAGIPTTTEFYDLGVATGGIPGNVSIIMNGVFPATLLDNFARTDDGYPLLGLPPQLVFAISVGTAANGSQTAFQSVVSDPGFAPFFLRTTAAASIHFLTGQAFTALTGEDGSVNIPFGPSQRFHFHGQRYTDVWINANGYVNFSAPTSAAAAGFTQDTLSWGSAEPSIAAYLTDWSPQVPNAATDGVNYLEVGSTISVSWGHPNSSSQGGISHFIDTDLNRFDIIMEVDNSLTPNPSEGGFIVDFPFLDLNSTTREGDGTVGHTPGGAALTGGLLDKSLAGNVNIGLAGEAQIEEHNQSGTAATYAGYDGLGANRAYHEFRRFNGNTLFFAPNPTAGLSGADGYSGIAAMLPPDDANAIDLGFISSAGGTLLTVAGSFFTFDPGATGAGTVTFDPSGAFGGPFLATPFSILDSSGQSGALADLAHTPGASPYRDGEALIIITPAMPGVCGVVEIEVASASGATASFNVGVDVQSLILPDDGSATVTLNFNTITWYGTAYSTLELGSNGYVSFGAIVGAVPNSYTPSDAALLAGFQPSPTTTATPGCAIAWNDMNRIGAGGTTGGGNGVYSVKEDSVNNTTLITMTNLDHWDTMDPAGTITARFNSAFGAPSPGSVDIDVTGFLASPASTQLTTVGVTDGDDVSAGSNSIVDLSASQGVYSTALSGVAPDSISETFNTSVGTDLTTITFLDGGIGDWTIL